MRLKIHRFHHLLCHGRHLQISEARFLVSWGLLSDELGNLLIIYIRQKCAHHNHIDTRLRYYVEDNNSEAGCLFITHAISRILDGIHYINVLLGIKSKCEEAVQTNIRSRGKRSHRTGACIHVYFLTFARFHQNLFEYYKNRVDTNELLALETFGPWDTENSLHLVHLAKVIISAGQSTAITTCPETVNNNSRAYEKRRRCGYQ